MDGYLYCNEDELGIPVDTFTRRFFILYPFCGLRWYLTEPPADLSYNKLLQHDLDDDSKLESGWVYGGNVHVDFVTIEKEIALFESEAGAGAGDGNIYPFVVKLRCGENISQVRLAAENESQRLAWIRELRSAESMQTYLIACTDKSAIPSRKVFASIRNVIDRKGIHFENMHVDYNMLDSICKYIQLSAPHGTTMLHSLRLENVNLGEVYDSIIFTLLSTMPHLTELSLAENNLGDAVIISVSAVLKDMTSLLEVDLSCNMIGDSGMETLAVALQSSKSLEKLDLSRNKLTSLSVRSMALHLCGHHSKLKTLNMAYNILGNGGAAMAAILMTNKPPSITDIDLSFTGISEVGIKELTKALGQCYSIQHLKVKGNTISDSEVLTKLVDAVSSHQKNFFMHGGSKRSSRSDLGLSLHIGGMSVDDISPRCISYQSSRKALPYVEDHTLLRSVSLRQRILKASNISFDANQVVTDPVDVATLCFFRLQLPLHIYSAQEFVEALAEGLGSNAQQFRIVSASSIELSTRSCDLILALEEATPRIKAALAARSVIPIYTAKLPIEKVSKKLNRDSAELPSVKKLLDSLHMHAENSTPFFRMLGIRTCSTQSAPSPENPLSARKFSYTISLSGSGGRVDHIDEHIPIVVPNDVDYYSLDNMAEADDSDDEGKALEILQEENYDNVYFQVHSSVRALGTISDRIMLTEQILKLEREATALRQKERKERRIASEQLVMTVRELRRSDEITTPVALFWEGAFGNAKCRAHTTDAMRSALNTYGVFHAVGRWNLLCEAMAVRDTPVMAAQIMHIKQDSLDGGTALLLGQRLLSEIISLQRDAVNLESLATQPDHIPFVENFLLACGKLGYSGPEMTAAAELRKKLIYWAAEERPELIKDKTDLIKQRALLSNLMISRDFIGLSKALDSGKPRSKSSTKSKNPRSVIDELAETVAAKELILTYKNVTNALIDAVKLRRIPRLEKAVAEAALLGLGLENIEVSRATRMLANLASMPVKLLKPIVAGMRDSNLSRVEVAIEAAYCMGWRIAALDLSIAPKILTKLSHITAIEETRAKLKQLALSVRNGFPVKAGEVLQLLRRADSYDLHNDQTNAVYFEQLNKFTKKFSSVLIQEKKIQEMIDDEDIEGLQEILSGKGKIKLVVHCASEELRNEWVEMLNASVLGKIDSRAIDDTDMLMSGTMDKAALSDKPPHELRGWRSRFFVLQGKTLSYFVARNGDRKGAVRVLGGDCRPLTPDEADGKKFGIEILEGRDLSLLAPDLLLEAKKKVDSYRVKEVESMLLRGMQEELLSLLESGLEQVEDGVQAEFNLVRKARSWIKRLRERNLKFQLHQAAITVPRAHMDELIRQAQSSLIDPSNTLISRLLRISELSDLAQVIVRARGAMETNDDTVFRRCIHSLSKFESKRFTTRDNRMITAVLFQHAGYRILRSETTGESSSIGVKLLRQALGAVRHLYVETEPMQIAKLLISIAEAETNPEGTFDKTKSSGLLAYLDDAALNEAMTSRFTIDKYDQLRAPKSDDKSVLGKLSSSGGALLSRIIGNQKPASQVPTASVPVADQHLSYTEAPITKSLLRFASGPKDIFNDLARCCFVALQAVMGDKKPKNIPKSKGGHMVPKEDIAEVMVALVEIGRDRQKLNMKNTKERSNDPAKKDSSQNMGDELYVQLCKQLTGNTNLVRRLRGWLLFSIYLHSFAPTKALSAYLKNFIAHSAALEQSMLPESLAKVRAAHERFKAADSDNFSKDADEFEVKRKLEIKLARHEELEARTALTKIALYCLKLICRLDKTEIEDSEMSLDSRGGQAQAQLVRNVCAAVIGRAPLTFEVVLLTGSEYRFTVKYGDIDTPYSILPILYGRLVGSQDELRHMMDKYNLKSKHRGHLAWQDWLMKQFRGFAFYSIDADKSVDTLLDIPVQAEESALCPWHNDILWNLVFNRIGASSQDQGDRSLAYGISGDIDTLIGKKFVLRRRIACSSELLAGSLELFQDQVADNDLVTNRSMWLEWLAGDKPLPADYIRVDLLFAEESRYVNSRLYHASEDCFYFLLGIQLALSWENVDPETWGEGADAILGNTDLSVRPAYQRPHNFASSLRSSSIAGDSKEGIRKRRFSKRASRITRFSTYFRRSTLGGEGVQKLGESLRKRLTLGGASSYALFGDTFQSSNQGETASQVSSEHGDLESKLSDEDDASEFYDTTSDEDSYQSDQELSSPDTSDSEGEKERKRQVTMTRERATGLREGGRLPIVSYADLYKAEITDLQQKLVGLGVDPNASSFDLEKAVEWMIKFQHLTDQPNQTLSTSSHQFRYLLKRAYLHYLQCWPLYGYHFTEAVLLLDEHGRRDVLVGISPSGILLLDPNNWTKVMHSSLFDIESASYNPGETQDDESFSARDTESSPPSSVTGSSRLSDSPDDATSNSMFSTPESDSRFSTPESNKSRGSSLSGGSSGKGKRSKHKGPRVSAMEKLPTIRDDDEESDPPSDSELPEDDPPGSSNFSDEEPPEDSDNEDSMGSPAGSEEPPSEEDDSEPPSPSDESSRSSASNARGGKRKSLKSTSSRRSIVSDSSSYSSSSRSKSETQTSYSRSKTETQTSYSRSYSRDKSTISSQTGTRSSRGKRDPVNQQRIILLRHEHLVLHFHGVNGQGEAQELTLRLVGDFSKDQLNLLQACSQEVLGRGAYPHGTEGGNDLLAPGEAQIAANDTKEIMRKFLRDFPILPIPPTPMQPALAPDYFDIPKSRHVLASEEREREEQAERENANRAAKAAEAQRRHERDKGKRTLRDDESVDIDIDLGDGHPEDPHVGTSVAPQEDLGLGDNHTNSLIVQAACGVPAARRARPIPPAPIRNAGKFRIDLPASRVAEPPDLPILNTQHPSSLPTVGTAWGGMLDQVGSGSLVRAAALSSPSKYVKNAGASALAEPGWSQHVAGYIARSNLLLEEIVDSEQLIQDTTEQEREYFYVGSTVKRRKKKERGGFF